MPLSAGNHLERDEILAPIGAGCRGEAYKDRDTFDWGIIVVSPRRRP